jgi:hypothetical protein
MHSPTHADTIERFMTTFFGYGSWTAPIWFIGMEEGWGSTVAEVTRRLAAWERRGERELEELVEYHRAIGVTRHLDDHAPLQPTWAKMIHVLLAARKLPSDVEAVRAFQMRNFGRDDGATCIVELLPLPSPNVRSWLYSEWGLEHLRDRKTYRQHLIPRRVASIRARVSSYRPTAVVFLGMSYLKHWQEIAGTPLNVRESVAVADGETIYIAALHPASRGTASSYFRAIGDLIAPRLS